MSRVYKLDRWKDRITIGSTAAAAEYLIALYDGSADERFYVLCLDTKNRLLRAELLNKGTISETAISIRAFVEIVIRNKSAGIILSHYHPSGSVQPSLNDIESTKNIIQVLSPIGIRLCDHIIVGGDKYFSFSARGLINNEEKKS